MTNEDKKTPAPVTHVEPIGWATVRVEDTCDGLLINADDMKRFGLRDDVQYEGHFLPDGRYRIAIPSPTPEKHVAPELQQVWRPQQLDGMPWKDVPEWLKTLARDYREQFKPQGIIQSGPLRSEAFYSYEVEWAFVSGVLTGMAIRPAAPQPRAEAK